MNIQFSLTSFNILLPSIQNVLPFHNQWYLAQSTTKAHINLPPRSFSIGHHKVHYISKKEKFNYNGHTGSHRMANYNFKPNHSGHPACSILYLKPNSNHHQISLETHLHHRLRILQKTTSEPLPRLQKKPTQQPQL